MLQDVYEKYISANGYKKDASQLALINLLADYSSQIEDSENLISRLFNRKKSKGLIDYGILLNNAVELIK